MIFCFMFCMKSELMLRFVVTASSTGPIMLRTAPHIAKSAAANATDQETDKVDRLINSTLDALERAVAEGFSDPFRIRAEPELEVVRGSERFSRIVEDLSSSVDRNAAN